MADPLFLSAAPVPDVTSSLSEGYFIT